MRLGDLLLQRRSGVSARRIGVGRTRKSDRRARFSGIERLEGRVLLTTAGDFNGDGYADLAIAAPGQSVGNVAAAGAVHVLNGTSTGLTGSGSQLWTQDDLSFTSAEPGDQFGTTMAVGDFDGDGRDDLAIGSPFEDWGSIQDTGMVQVIYGSSSGLTASGNQRWYQGSSGIADAIEAGDLFGETLTVGDFNGDGRDDLAIGAPGESVDNHSGAGAVHVLYGSSSGLTAFRSQFWTQDPIVGTSAEHGDHFGAELAAGDFDGDGRDDLAIGSPDETWTDVVGAGVVQVLPGSSSGLTSVGSRFFTQNSVAGSGANGVDTYDWFGYSLAAGDFDGDGRDDLAIGAPGEDVDDGGGSFDIDAGSVHVLYGGSSGLSATGFQIWTQNLLPGTSLETGDGFGRALAAGDFDGDGRDDLAIGSPFEDWGSIQDAGVVHVLYGTSSGLTASGSDFWHQENSGSRTDHEEGDRFGYSLGAGDFDGDGRDDLVIGSPFEDWGTIQDAGVVHVLYGTSSGLTTTRRQFWYQGSAGIADNVDAGNRFGYQHRRAPFYLG